ncbi:hypothetical protein [Nesterenkonia marinintestina]|uniref:hypothetical protein n=1 Tax=Nesterenkonia marinintestina TaxID=2979865 RepID=UPI0021BE5724|nr:hypothetical protein [Nesterenkonia sp. GX14115]
MATFHLTMRLTTQGSTLIKEEEHPTSIIDGFTGEHLLRGAEGFVFQVDRVEQDGDHVVVTLSDPVDEEGLNRDPVRALFHEGWREATR